MASSRQPSQSSSTQQTGRLKLVSLPTKQQQQQEQQRTPVPSSSRSSPISSPNSSPSNSAAFRRGGENFDAALTQKITSLIGAGPMRFGPIKTEVPIDSNHDVQVFELTKANAVQEGLQKKFTDTQILRVLQHFKYNTTPTMNMLRRMNPRYLNVTAQHLEQQLLATKTVFPLPNQISAYGAQDLLYMRASRFSPARSTPTQLVASLVYAMDAVYERHRDTSRTMGLLVNMKGWTKDSFKLEVFQEMMGVLQGRKVPFRIDLLIMVNRPKWFDSIWTTIVAPQLKPEFRKKVQLVHEDSLNRLLKPGFEEHLPDDLRAGTANTDDLVHDFIAFRMFLEAETRERLSFVARSSTAGRRSGGNSMGSSFSDKESMAARKRIPIVSRIKKLRRARR